MVRRQPSADLSEAFLPALLLVGALHLDVFHHGILVEGEESLGSCKYIVGDYQIRTGAVR
jgi:hypothetical protein